MKDFKTRLKSYKRANRIRRAAVLITLITFLISSSRVRLEKVINEDSVFSSLVIDVEIGKDIFEGIFTLNDKNYSYNIRNSTIYEIVSDTLDLYVRFIPRGVNKD